MVPSETSVELQLVFLFVVEVSAKHLGGIQSVTTSAKASSSTSARESHVVGVVGIAHEHYICIVLEEGTHTTCSITVASTCSNVKVREHTLVHTTLHGEVEHGLLLAVVDARHPCEVALLVVCLHLFYYICR